MEMEKYGKGTKHTTTCVKHGEGSMMAWTCMGQAEWCSLMM